MTPRQAEIAFWTLLCAGLAGGIGIETDRGRRWEWPQQLTAEAKAAFDPPALTDPYHLPSADQFLETAARPVFVATRRPAPAATAPEAEQPRMKRDQFALSGVTISPEGKFAYLVEKSGNRALVVREGREINGIKVMDISPDRITLSQYGETEVVILKTVKAPAGTPTPPAQASAARLPVSATPPAATAAPPPAATVPPPSNTAGGPQPAATTPAAPTPAAPPAGSPQTQPGKVASPRVGVGPF
jgi:hypothetical protein